MRTYSLKEFDLPSVWYRFFERRCERDNAIKNDIRTLNINSFIVMEGRNKLRGLLLRNRVAAMEQGYLRNTFYFTEL